MNLGDAKWHMPGWRIEQKYSTGVLIGNWSEDRLGKVYIYKIIVEILNIILSLLVVGSTAYN